MFVDVNELVENQTIQFFRGHGSPPGACKGLGDIPYVRAGDIVDWEIYKNPISSVTEEVYLSSKGNGVDLEERDIIFVKEGSYRVGDVAMLSKHDTKILLNSHCLVFRVDENRNNFDIDAFYLLYLFSHPLTKKQLYNKVMIDTTLPNIGDRWKELKLPIFIDCAERIAIKKKLRKLFLKHWKLKKQFIDVKTDM